MDKNREQAIKYNFPAKIGIFFFCMAAHVTAPSRPVQAWTTYLAMCSLP